MLIDILGMMMTHVQQVILALIGLFTLLGIGYKILKWIIEQLIDTNIKMYTDVISANLERVMTDLLIKDAKSSERFARVEERQIALTRELHTSIEQSSLISSKIDDIHRVLTSSNNNNINNN